jgi:uncharacterized protein YciW
METKTNGNTLTITISISSEIATDEMEDIIDYLIGIKETTAEMQDIRNKVRGIVQCNQIDMLLEAESIPLCGNYGDTLAKYIYDVVGISEDWRSYRDWRKTAYREVCEELEAMGK